MSQDQTPENIAKPVPQNDNIYKLPTDSLGEYGEVLDQIEKQQTKNTHWITNIILLMFTLIIFYQLEAFNGTTGILLLILVLFVHEMGHFLSMRLFGYKNLQMFFIPLFGAAVSGQGTGIANWKKAVVALLGPLPGLIISIALIASDAFENNPTVKELAYLFLVINLFNLLPVLPLDGGRFMNEIIYSRAPILESSARFFAAIILALLGWFLEARLFMFLAVLMLINFNEFRAPFKIKKIARDIRDWLSTRDVAYLPGSSVKTTPSDLIPIETAREIIRHIYQAFPKQPSPQGVADYTIRVWDKIHTKSAGIFASLLLLSLYTIALFAPPITAGTIYAFNHPTITYTQTRTPEGKQIVTEEKFVFGNLYSQAAIDPNRNIYHGPITVYRLSGSIRKQGQFTDGKWDGQWKTYDTNEKVIRITTFKKGKFISARELKNNNWIDVPFDQLPASIQKTYRNHESEPPMGPTQNITKPTTQPSP